MKHAWIAAAAVAALSLGGCAYHRGGGERVSVGVSAGGGYYDVYYDAGYGAFSDGYWAMTAPSGIPTPAVTGTGTTPIISAATMAAMAGIRCMAAARIATTEDKKKAGRETGLFPYCLSENPTRRPGSRACPAARPCCAGWRSRW